MLRGVRFCAFLATTARAACARLCEIDFAELNRLSYVIRRLMLQTKRFDLRVELWQVFDELFDNNGIEMNTSAAQQQRGCFTERHTATERTIFTNRVEAVDHGNNARCNRNLLAPHFVGITTAFPLLVMMTNDRNHRIRKVHARENLRAHDRMNLHPLKLSRSQRAGLIQDMRRHGKLAHIMK